MTKFEVYDYLISLNQNNTQGLDNIDGKILKMAAPIISDSLTHVYNSCIESNYFPNAFKEAKVVPLYKAGDKTNPSNYRPISILSLLSKPLEKHLQKHIVHHLDKYRVFQKKRDRTLSMRSNHIVCSIYLKWLHSYLNILSV